MGCEDKFDEIINLKTWKNFLSCRHNTLIYNKNFVCFKNHLLEVGNLPTLF